MARKRSTERREDIIDATLALLAEAPPGEVSTRDVAARVGISQPAIFKHFESRDVLFTAVVEHVRDELADELGGALEHSSPLTALLLVCDKLFHYAELRPGLPRLLVFDVSRGGEASFHKHLRGLVAMQRTTFRHLLDREVASGGLPSDLDTKTAAMTLVALIQGALLSWLHCGQKHPPTDLAHPAIEQWVHAVRAGLPQKTSSNEEPPIGEVCSGVPDVPAVVRAPKGQPVPLARLDVRPVIEDGGEPLTSILETLAAAHPQGLLELTAPFEPRPLLRLLEGQGAAATCERVAEKHYRIWVRPSETTPFLDLRDLPAPEPLEAVLEATASLAPGRALLAIVPQFPRLLIPHLVQRDLLHSVLESEDCSIVFARRPASGETVPAPDT